MTDRNDYEGPGFLNPVSAEIDARNAYAGHSSFLDEVRRAEEERREFAALAGSHGYGPVAQALRDATSASEMARMIAIESRHGALHSAAEAAEAARSARAEGEYSRHGMHNAAADWRAQMLAACAPIPHPDSLAAVAESHRDSMRLAFAGATTSPAEEFMRRLDDDSARPLAHREDLTTPKFSTVPSACASLPATMFRQPNTYRFHCVKCKTTVEHRAFDPHDLPPFVCECHRRPAEPHPSNVIDLDAEREKRKPPP
jgi:hypothetical protein